MTTYYVDPAGSNTSPYDTWVKAATSIQTALDTANTAGDVIYCRGTEVLGATVDVDTNTGTNAGGWIKVVGCNAAGNVDGTRFILDANGGTFHVMTFTNTADMYWLENIEVKNTAAGTYNGFYASAASSLGCVFINCCANTCGLHGFYNRFDYGTFIRCLSYSNGSYGFAVLYCCRFFACMANNNTNDGFSVCTDGVFIGCVSHENTDNGFEVSATNFVFNCVADKNTDDGFNVIANSSLYGPTLLGCRATNHNQAGTDAGLNCNSEPCVYGWNYFQDNGDAAADDIINELAGSLGMVQADSATLGKAGHGTTDTNQYSGADTNDGYVSNTDDAENFSTNYVDATDPTARRIPITIPYVADA